MDYSKPTENQSPDENKDDSKPGEEQDRFRPRVRSYPKGKFHVDDKVYIRSGRGLAGPYLVSSITSGGTYVLCNEDGTKAENGQEFIESDLQHA